MGFGWVWVLWVLFPKHRHLRSLLGEDRQFVGRWYKMRRLGLNELLTSNQIAGPSEGKAVFQDTRPNPVIAQRFLTDWSRGIPTFLRFSKRVSDRSRRSLQPGSMFDAGASFCSSAGAFSIVLWVGHRTQPWQVRPMEG